MKRPLLVFSSILIVACSQGPEDTVQVPQAEDDRVTYTQTIPSQKDMVDETGAAEEWFAIGAISGVNDTAANGVTQSQYFSSGIYKHGMQLNIEQAPDGYFYEGWLVHPETKEFFSTGEITPLFDDVRHAFQYETNEDVRIYTKVVVTLEPRDNDPAPAAHVAEAQLKEVER